MNSDKGEEQDDQISSNEGYKIDQEFDKESTQESGEEFIKELNEELCENDDSDDAPEEIDFNLTKKTAIQLAERQSDILNKIKKQEQEKRKLNQDRNIEQKKLKKNKGTDKLDDEDFIKSIEKETATSKLKIILNMDDKIDKINNKFIKKYKETNNRMISFKERSIQTNPNIRRTDNSEANRLLHKRKVK